MKKLFKMKFLVPMLLAVAVFGAVGVKQAKAVFILGDEQFGNCIYIVYDDYGNVLATVSVSGPCVLDLIGGKPAVIGGTGGISGSGSTVTKISNLFQSTFSAAPGAAQ